MYILLSKNYRPFVAGIFSNITSHDNFVSRIPQSLTKHLKTIELDLSYPFYLTEDYLGFNYYSEQEIKQKMESFIAEMPQRDEDWCYTNLYKIDSDFEPKRPGHDYMGQLNHHHVNNGILNCAMKEGFDALW